MTKSAILQLAWSGNLAVLYCIAFVLLTALLWYSDIQHVLLYIVSIPVSTTLVAGLVLIVVTLLGAINTFLFVGRDHRVHFSGFLPVYWVSWAFGLVVPGQVADIGSLGILLRCYGLSLATVVGRAALDKLVSASVMVFIAVAGLAGLGQVAAANRAVTMIIALSLLMCSGFAERRYLRRVFDPKLPGWRGGIGRTAVELLETANAARWRLFVNVTLTFIKVIATGFVYWITLDALGSEELSLLLVTAAATAAGLIAYLPISVNGLGTVEAVGIFLFGQLGVPAAAVLAAYLILRLLVLLIAWLPALVWLLALMLLPARSSDE